MIRFLDTLTALTATALILGAAFATGAHIALLR